MTRVRTEQYKTYHRNHVRVHSRRGRATYQICVKCEGPAQEWAQVHGESGEDPWADFVPLCRSCHREYDFADLSRKVSESLRGRSPSTEARQKMRLAKLGRTLSSETKAKIAAAGRGRKHSEESRAKMSRVQKGKYVSDDTREKLRAAWVIRRERDKKHCEVGDCDNIYLAKGLCRKHYSQRRREQLKLGNEAPA